MRTLRLLILSLAISQISQAQTDKLPCGTDFEWQESMRQHPEFVKSWQQFEAGYSEFKKSYNPEMYKVTPGSQKKAAKYIIPVVVHIFHANGSENLTDNQIVQAINRLNQYAAGTISGISQVRDIFKDRIADTEIEFRLARKDPGGNCTNGITRTYTTQTYRGGETLKKMMSWDTQRYLNIWLCADVYSGGRSVGGYATLPFNELAGRSGLLCDNTGFLYSSTGIHELGHWLGLLHPFQSDDSCSTTNDGVDDTPPTYFKMSTTAFNTGRGDYCGNPNYNSCTSFTAPDTADMPDMQENIMDYFGGSCSSLMFTLEQKARMIYCLEQFRPKIISQENLVATGTETITTANCAPIAAFNTRTPSICSGGNTNFIDFSYNTSTISSYSWVFPGGSPGEFTGKTPPSISYSNPGSYDVKLTVSNAVGNNTLEYKNYVQVKPATADQTPGWMETADWWYQNNWKEKGWYFDDGVASRGFTRFGISYANNASMMLEQDPFSLYNSLGNSFTLYSPSFNFSNASKPYFAFNFAFARTPGFTDNSGNRLPTTETLTLHSSSDCGKTWISRVNLSGKDVSSVGDITLTQATYFVPANASKWKEVVFTGATFPKASNVMFKITFTYSGGNNFFLDNVRLGDGVASGIQEDDLSRKIGFLVSPNPFIQETSLSYTLENSEPVSVRIFDVLGKEVGVLFEGLQMAGPQNLVLNKSDLGLGTGVYFIRMEVGGKSLNHKILAN